MSKVRRVVPTIAVLCIAGSHGFVSWGSGPGGPHGLRASTSPCLRQASDASKQLDLQAPGTRIVRGRRLVSTSKRRKGKPYDPGAGAKSRRNIGWLLVVMGSIGILSETPSDGPYSEGFAGIGSTSSSSSSTEWAHSTPVIEKGSILMARPGDTFAQRQQYFHKSVVLVIKHDDAGDMGIIINRPSGFNTAQLGLKGPSWNIWFGGDCEGIRDAHVRGIRSFCLHVRDDFASMSKEVTRGVYLISFEKAQDLVAAGQAQTSDFMLFLGYCGWIRNQLQGELNVGVWKMASVDSRVIVRELREETLELRQLPSLGLDDGVGLWRHLCLDGTGLAGHLRHLGHQGMGWDIKGHHGACG
eukprot:Skav201622  [mRNA]  locus=scaffold3582:5170:7285:+ [translate_table: standard]